MMKLSINLMQLTVGFIQFPFLLQMVENMCRYSIIRSIRSSEKGLPHHNHEHQFKFLNEYLYKKKQVPFFT